MLNSFFTNALRPTRSVVIELRDGRRFKGELKLSPDETAASLLRKATPFLKVRTKKGDVAINRHSIAALLLGDDEIRLAHGPHVRPISRDDVKAPRSRRAYTAYDAADAFARTEQQRPERPKVDPALQRAFRVLKLQPGANQAQIKMAWRRRIAECHPDRVSGGGASKLAVEAAQEEAAQVNAAYQMLSEAA